MQYVLLLLLTLSSLLIGSNSWAAISFDSVTSGLTTANPVLTVAATTPACANPILIVASMQETSGLIQSVTYNGDAMTAGTTEVSYQSGAGHSSMYYLLTPDAGTNNVVVTYSDVTTDRVAAIALFYCASDAIGDTDQAAAETLTLTTVEDGSWVVACITDISPDDFTIGGDLTNERSELDGTNHSMSCGDGPKATAGSFNVTYTEGAATANGIMAIEIRPADVAAGSRRVGLVQ